MTLKFFRPDGPQPRLAAALEACGYTIEVTTWPPLQPSDGFALVSRNHVTAALGSPSASWLAIKSECVLLDGDRGSVLDHLERFRLACAFDQATMFEWEHRWPAGGPPRQVLLSRKDVADRAGISYATSAAFSREHYAQLYSDPDEDLPDILIRYLRHYIRAP